MAGPGHHGHAALTTPYQPTVSSVRDRESVSATTWAGLGEPLALDARPSLTGVRRRRGEEVGVGMEFADECQAVAVAVAEAGDFMASIGGIAGEDEGAIGEADQ